MSLLERIRKKAQGVVDLFNPSVPLKPGNNVLNSISKQPILGASPYTPTVGQGFNFLKQAAQGIARGIPGLALTAQDVISPQAKPREFKVSSLSDSPFDRLQKALYGKDETIRSVGATQNLLEKDYGIPGIAALGIAAIDPLTNVTGIKALARQGLKQGGEALIKQGGNVVKLSKRAKDTMYVTPEGTAFKLNKQPKTSAGLDEVIEQVKKVNPNTPIPEGLKLPSGERLMLPPGKKPKPPKPPKPTVELFDIGNKVNRSLRSMFLDTPAALKKTFKTSYDTTIKPIIEAHGVRLGAATDWKNQYRNMLGKLPVKAGSTEDKLLHEFRTPDGYRKVASRVGRKRANELQSTYEQLRASYDEILDFVNTQRRNAGLNEIPKKDDFLSQVGGSQRSIFDDILEGGTQTTGATSGTIFKEQLGNPTRGAVESMRDYLELAARAGFSDLSANELRLVRESLATKGAPREALEQLIKLEDRILGSKEMGKVEKGILGLTGKMRSAAVVGKVGTIVNQFLATPQAFFATGPINFTKGFISGEAKNAVKQSNFLKAVGDKVPRNLRTGNAYTKAVGIAGDALVNAQQAANTMTWRGFYEMARSKGLKGKEAIQFADELTPKIVGDRRLGMSPEVYNSLVGKIFGAFTIEPTAAVTRLFSEGVAALKGNPRALGEVMGTVVAWHLVNKANEKYGQGYAPYPDAIEAVLDSIEYTQGSDEKEKSNLKAVGRIFSEMLQTTPVINSIFNTAYSFGESADLVPNSREVFGQDDNTWMSVASLYNPFDKTDRNITGNDFIDVPVNVASKFAPFVEQGARSTQSLFNIARGYSLDKRGDPLYAAPDDLASQTRSVLFGQSATPEAQEFFKTDFAPFLTDRQKDIMALKPGKESKVDYLKETQNRNLQKNRTKNLFEERSDVQVAGETNKPEGALNKLLGFFDREEKPVTFTEPKTKSEKIETDKQTDLSLEAGNIPEEAELKSRFFDGKDYSSAKDNDQQESVLKSLNTALQDEYLTEDQKNAILRTSKVPQAELEYYNLASMNDRDQLQTISNKVDEFGENREGLITWLIGGRKKVAGKSFITNDMADFLYDQEVLSKEEKNFINSWKFNPITKEFYQDRDYKGGSGGGSKKNWSIGGDAMTETQAKAFINKVNSIFKLEDTKFTTKKAPKSVKAPKLKFSDSKPKGRSSNQWFNSY